MNRDHFDDELSELASTLLPSHGYFGGFAVNHLKVPVAKEIDKIQIRLRGDKQKFLNLSQIIIFNENAKAIDLKDHVELANLSSAYNSGSTTDMTSKVITGESVHSGQERNPHLTIKLKSAMTVSHITIKNRNGINGARSLNLNVSFWNNDTQVTNYLNTSDFERLRLLTKLADITKVSLATDLSTENRRLIKLEELHSNIAISLLDNNLQLTLKEAYALIPIFDSKPIVNRNILTFCGALIAELLIKNGKIQTRHLLDLERILDSPNRIEFAGQAAETIIQQRIGNDTEVVIGKHNIGTTRLSSKLEKFETVIDLVLQQLSDWGFEAVLCYGTLLGAVRNNSFIPHDDDVDVLYFDDSKNRHDMIHNRNKLLQRFREADYKIWDSGTNFQVSPKGYPVGVDIFPCFQDGDDTSVMMENYLYRKIPTSLLKSMSTVKLYEKNYPAPANPQGFLQQRYGNDWKVSNPYYEWPWNLDSLSDWPVRSRERALNPSRLVTVAWGQKLGPKRNGPPANSPSLIKSAIRLGFDAVELDVRQAKGGEFVLGHNDTLINKKGQQIKLSTADRKSLKDFNLGRYFLRSNPVITLGEATKLLPTQILHLDPRIAPEHYGDLRKALDKAGFDSGKIVFCGYGYSALRELTKHFPESVLLNKYYSHFNAIDDFMMDELKARNIDGLMLFWPLHYENSSAFMKKLKERDLQVLFYCHGAWPWRGEIDNKEASFQHMIDVGANYVTTVASNLKPFKSLIAKPY